MAIWGTFFFYTYLKISIIRKLTSEAPLASNNRLSLCLLPVVIDPLTTERLLEGTCGDSLGPMSNPLEFNNSGDFSVWT